MQNSLINNDLLNRVGVDIVLPNYNSYPFIEETLKSIISQTFKKLEIIYSLMEILILKLKKF